MVRQYQVVLDPDRLAAYDLPHNRVIEAMKRANQEAGGSVLELGEAEYMVRASGYLRSLDDFRAMPLMTTDAGVSVRLGDVARVQVGPEMRRGIGELDGEGEAAGGVIVMRSGQNALETIAAVKAKLEALKPGLPPGVEIVPTYDRSGLIERAVANLRNKLVEEFIVVALVCGLFLFHLRSAFVAIVSLPLGVLIAFIVMQLPGREREHHVAGRHRDRHRRDGRCGGGDDRERAQAARALGARASGPNAGRRRALARDRRRGGGSGAGALLLAAHHHVRSCRCSACRRRRGGCSRRWPSPRPMRWPRPRGWR